MRRRNCELFEASRGENGGTSVPDVLIYSLKWPTGNSSECPIAFSHHSCIALEKLRRKAQQICSATNIARTMVHDTYVSIVFLLALPCSKTFCGMEIAPSFEKAKLWKVTGNRRGLI